jgi:cystathionine gamma-synthase
MTKAVDNPIPSVSLGSSVPPFTPHAISVSLPTWRDNVGYEEGEKRVVDSMVSGYPRFFIHLSIRKVCCHGSNLCLQVTDLDRHD